MHNTNGDRKFRLDPVNAEEFAVMLQHCVPLRPGREAELSAMRLGVLLVIVLLDGTEDQRSARPVRARPELRQRLLVAAR